MSQIKVAIVPVTPFQQNCSLLICEASGKAAVVDPGGDLPLILRAIEQTGAKVEKILLTHGHADHAGGAAELREKLGVTIEGPHIGDKFLLDSLEASSARFGFVSRDVTPDRWLEHGDRVQFGEVSFDVRHCPGHTPGSVLLVNAAMNFCLVGDVLFQGSIGRTDLPGGDHALFMRSIAAQILTLDDGMAFIPGHGPMGAIGEERRHNPYLRELV